MDWYMAVNPPRHLHEGKPTISSGADLVCDGEQRQRASLSSTRRGHTSTGGEGVWRLIGTAFLTLSLCQHVNAP